MKDCQKKNHANDNAQAVGGFEDLAVEHADVDPQDVFQGKQQAGGRSNVL